MIEVSKLDFAYDGQGFRLRSDEFSVNQGQRIALIGPSGSGKSTLLHLLAGILSPVSGSIKVNGCDLSGLNQNARRAFRIANIGLVFQSFELLEYLPVRENLLLPFRLSGTLQLTSEIRQRAEELANDLEIADKLNRYPKQLSQGERQRVAIGRALITDPMLLLADEPTGNLDPTNKQLVLDLMLEHAAQRGVTVVMVTHDHGLLDRFESVFEICGSKEEQQVAEIVKYRRDEDSQVQQVGVHDR